jgi:glycosyltransferase involved in cell wall biosynthesis
MKVKIVYPVYNDWEALNLLMTKTADIFEKKEVELSYLAVDDCSSIPFVASDFCDFDFKVLHLISNQGHQRAIAIGLSYLVDNNNADLVVVMDSDGEDQPEHILNLIEKSKSSPDKIIFAQRNKRTESFAFKLFYLVYKFIFKFLTGHVITFGNYSLIPASKIKKLANVSEIWNNYPGGVIRSKLPFDSVPLNRGVRLAGKSKMNFTSLILHGMSAISVFLDFTTVRILIFASAMVSCSVIGAGVAIYFKFVLHQATPGWASNLVMGFFIVFIQGFFIALFILFMVLSSRRYTSFIPYFGYNKYIDFVE